MLGYVGSLPPEDLPMTETSAFPRPGQSASGAEGKPPQHAYRGLRQWHVDCFALCQHNSNLVVMAIRRQKGFT
jgi:hypothetical protein